MRLWSLGLSGIISLLTYLGVKLVRINYVNSGRYYMIMTLLYIHINMLAYHNIAYICMAMYAH